VNEKQANKNDQKHKKYLDSIHLKEFKVVRAKQDAYNYHLGTNKVGYMKKVIKIITTRHRYLELRAKILER